MKDIILKYSLDNAIKYGGKASVGSVMGKVLKENPDLRTKTKEVTKQIEEVLEEVNSLTLDEQIAKLKILSPHMLEKKESTKKEALKELKNTNVEQVVMRFAPSPSGPLHIGHSYVLSLNSEYVRKYDGKLIIRIEDTNAAN